jgi:hypothetical protein
MGDGFRYLIDGFWGGKFWGNRLWIWSTLLLFTGFSHDKFVYGLQHLGVDGYSNVVVGYYAHWYCVSHNISCIPLFCCFCPHCVPYVLGFKTTISLIDNINDIDLPSLSIDAAQHSIYGGQYYSVLLFHKLIFYMFLLYTRPLIYYSVFVSPTNS